MEQKVDGETFFKDWLNPTKEELLTWSYSNAYEPEQDFELFVVDDPEFTLSLAGDDKNPSQTFFLGSLYVFVGDTVRIEVGETLKNKAGLEKLLIAAEISLNPKIMTFVARTKELLQNPKSYSYEKWGIGGEYSVE